MCECEQRRARAFQGSVVQRDEYVIVGIYFEGFFKYHQMSDEIHLSSETFCLVPKYAKKTLTALLKTLTIWMNSFSICCTLKKQTKINCGCMSLLVLCDTRKTDDCVHLIADRLLSGGKRGFKGTRPSWKADPRKRCRNPSFAHRWVILWGWTKKWRPSKHSWCALEFLWSNNGKQHKYKTTHW